MVKIIFGTSQNHKPQLCDNFTSRILEQAQIRGKRLYKEEAAK